MSKMFRSLIFWEGLSFAVAFLGGRAMNGSSMLWYSELSRSSITPPNIAFPIVWTLLYALMGYSAYRISNRANIGALIPYTVQLALNLAWSWIFFYFRQPTAGLVNILLLVFAVLWTAAEFRKHDRVAAALLIPYILWGCFAFWLNLYIVLYN